MKFWTWTELKAKCGRLEVWSNKHARRYLIEAGDKIAKYAEDMMNMLNNWNGEVIL